MRALRIGLSGLFALAGVPQVARAQDDKPTVAVIQIDVASIGSKNSGDLSAALADMITTELGKKPSIRVIDRVQIQDMLTKQKLLVSGRVSDEDAMRAGKLLGAQYIVSGSATFVGPTVRLDMRITEAETSRILRSFKQSGKQDDLLSIVDQLAADFTKDLKLPSKAALAKAETPVPAILSYSRGLDFEKRGKTEQAARMYEKSLQLSPDYEDAQKALARVK
ncbi:MAG: CsgG/HfaB family protein [Gemmatimonadota bacterium]